MSSLSEEAGSISGSVTALPLLVMTVRCGSSFSWVKLSYVKFSWVKLSCVRLSWLNATVFFLRLGKLDTEEKLLDSRVGFLLSPRVLDRSRAGLLGPKFRSLSETSLTELCLDSFVPSMLTLRH